MSETSETENQQFERKTRISIGTVAKCPLCLEEKDSSYFYRLECDHQLCLSCFHAYLISNLKDQSKYPLKCFSPDCKRELSYTDIKEGLSKDELLIYDKFSLRVNLLNDSTKQAIYCPFSKCDTMMVVSTTETQSSTRQVCTTCSREFCSKCMLKWHAGKTCEEVKSEDGEGETRKGENLALFRQLASQEKWLPCPACGMMIERTGGCHHMSHLRAAGCTTKGEATHFCALCSMILGGKYHKDEPDGALHFPGGLFKACRVVAKLIAEGKMAPLPPSEHDGEEVPPGAAVADPQADLGRSWQSSLLCACWESDLWTCIKSCCCPCYVAGETEEMLPMLGGGGKWCNCLKYCCCWCWIAPLKRLLTRRMFAIRGCCPIDCCISNLCPCCSVLQERNELVRRAAPEVMAMV